MKHEGNAMGRHQQADPTKHYEQRIKCACGEEIPWDEDWPECEHCGRTTVETDAGGERSAVWMERGSDLEIHAKDCSCYSCCPPKCSRCGYRYKTGPEHGGQDFYRHDNDCFLRRFAGVLAHNGIGGP